MPSRDRQERQARRLRRRPGAEGGAAPARGRAALTATLTIRRSGPSEADTLLEIQRAACVAALPHIYPPELYPFPDDDVRRRWRDFRGRVVVAERDGRPVGLAGVDACWLNGLYVVPDEWGSGVATSLHDHALAAMEGCEVAHLWVLEENHRARRFYERRGWRLNGETRVVPFPPNPLDVGYSLTR